MLNDILKKISGLNKSYKITNTYSGKDKRGDSIGIQFCGKRFVVHKTVFGKHAKIKSVLIDELDIENVEKWVTCLLACKNTLEFKSISVYLTYDYENIRLRENKVMIPTNSV